MPYDNTQEKRGTERLTNPNRKRQPGKGDGTDVLRQPKGSTRLTDNYPNGPSTNKTNRIRPSAEGQLAGPDGRGSTGYVHNEAGSKPPTRKTGKVKSIGKD